MSETTTAPAEIDETLDDSTETTDEPTTVEDAPESTDDEAQAESDALAEVQSEIEHDEAAPSDGETDQVSDQPGDDFSWLDGGLPAPDTTPSKAKAEPETPPVPADDAKVAPKDALERAVLLIKAGLTNVALRETLDERAFEMIGRALNARVADQTMVEHTEDLPVYKQSGQGSMRYTGERAKLLFAIATANAVSARLSSTGYWYPNPQSKRKAYFVQAWGTQLDMDRTLELFRAFQERAMKDAYAINVDGLKPAQQTAKRRAFMNAFVDAIDTRLRAVIDEFRSSHPSGASQFSQRAVRAREAQGTWAGQNATSENPVESEGSNA